jgi:hypothetical protein
LKANVLNRKVHYWIAFVALVPLAVMIASGLLLQMKKHWAWVQPVEQRGIGTVPRIDLAGMLTAARSVQMGVSSWDDINRIDVRPDRGVAKIWLQNGYEVQVDLGNGQVLQTAYRRSDLIESIHDGSFFGGDFVKTRGVLTNRYCHGGLMGHRCLDGVDPHTESPSGSQGKGKAVRYTLSRCAEHYSSRCLLS